MTIKLWPKLLDHYNETGSQPLGGCGESSVVIKGKSVEGRKLTNDGYVPYTLTIEDLVKYLQKKPGPQ